MQRVVCMDLQEFLERMSTNGVWAVAEPAETTKRFISSRRIPDPVPTIQKYSQVQKYMRRGERITVVSLANELLGNEEFAGIQVFRAEDMEFRQEDKIVIVLKAYARQEVLTFEDHSYMEGHDLVEDGGFPAEGPGRRLPVFRLGDGFSERLLASGYVTRTEWELCNDPEIFALLPRVRIELPPRKTVDIAGTDPDNMSFA